MNTNTVLLSLQISILLLGLLSTVLVLNILKSHVTHGNTQGPGHLLPHVVSEQHGVHLLGLTGLVRRKELKLHLIDQLADCIKEAGDEAMWLVPGPADGVMLEVILDEDRLHGLPRQEPSRLE